MKKLTSIVLLAVLLSGCSDPTDAGRTLDDAERIMTEKPDSAKTLLESLDRQSLRTRKNRARFALLYSQALDKNYIDVDRDTLIRLATEFYRHRGSSEEKTKACFYRGRVYENAGKTDSAVVLYTQAEQYAQKTDDYYLKGLVANALAGMYSSQNFMPLAAEKYLEAADYYARIGHKLNTLKSYIGAIIVFSSNNEYTQQEHYLNISKSLATELQDSSKLLFLSRSRANLIIDRDKDYSQALAILHDAVNQYAGNLLPNAYCIMIANLYIKLNHSDSAQLYLQPLIDNLEQESSRSKIEILYLQSKIYGQQGDYEQAQDCSLRALHICDSLYFAEKEHAIPELKEKYRNEQLVLRNQYLRKISIYQGYTALAALIAIVSGSLWLINRRQRKILQQKQEIAEYSEAIAKLKNEYEALQTQYDGERQETPAIDESMLARRIDFLKQILDITSNFQHDKEKFHEKIENLLTKSGNGQSKKQPSEIFLMFQDLLEMRRPGIIAFIRNRYPSITPQEMALYCMICMDVSKSAICLVLGNKQKTYYNYRNVLRNKLNLTYDNMTIREHFQSMCTEYAEREKR